MSLERPGNPACINTFGGAFLHVICGGLAAGPRRQTQLPRHHVQHSLEQRWLRTPADTTQNIVQALVSDTVGWLKQTAGTTEMAGLPSPLRL